MATEYNQDQSSGLKSELDEPRRTTDEVQSDDLGTGAEGVSEEPPHHTLHSDDEPLPKPTPGTYDEDLPSSEPREEQFTDAPQSTEDYQEPTNFDESPAETGAGGATNGGYADPSAAFPGAPVDRKLEEPGYGYDQKTSEPALASSEPALDSTTPAETTTPTTPKKESFINKIMDKLPGHHKKTADTVDPDATVEDDTTSAPPKKESIINKIKDKLPGHHSTPTTTE